MDRRSSPTGHPPADSKAPSQPQPQQQHQARSQSPSTSHQQPHELPASRLTLKTGAPLGDKFNSLLLGPRGPNLLADTALIEENANFNRERIPERVVHAKGVAALGVFEVTKSDICAYTKASLFSTLGKQTPVIVRFSHVVDESGAADTVRDIRGFAVKFYTDQGNWDLVGNNVPVFFVRDPINFVSLIHALKRNPKTHLRDPNAMWDFFSLVPESLHALLMLFSERGLPDGFRHMHGYGVHTFKLVNARKEAFYCKFHWICRQGIRNLDQTAATRVAGLNPDYSIRDLQTQIARGHQPSWTLCAQVMAVADAQRVSFNVLDVTKTWPHAQWPLIEIGKLTLNQNVENYFAQTEQLAFSPSAMVPGIEASTDKMLVGRMFAYPDAARYRLGGNYLDIPVNRPHCPVMTPTYCDGLTMTSNLGAGSSSAPNYLPSARLESVRCFDGQFVEHEQQFVGHTGRFNLATDDNYSQPRQLYASVLKDDARRTLAINLADSLFQVTNRDTVSRILQHFEEIDPRLFKAVEHFMATRASRKV